VLNGYVDIKGGKDMQGNKIMALIVFMHLLSGTCALIFMDIKMDELKKIIQKRAY
jgi:hypothetical protein